MPASNDRPPQRGLSQLPRLHSPIHRWRRGEAPPASAFLLAVPKDPQQAQAGADH